MDIVNKLHEALLKQPFSEEQSFSDLLLECQQVASIYARIENAIAVLSDLKTDTSYIYYGGMAERLGLARGDSRVTIHSIWEEDIFNRIHPDDLLEKHIQELRFFHFLKGIPEKERKDYHIVSPLRMRDQLGEYVPVLHRMFYVATHSNGNVGLALCLYNLAGGIFLHPGIVNSADGHRIEFNEQASEGILSDREKEILTWIEQGKRSKEIALVLSISINTVNRHRQNILEKLHVSNSIEACRIAKELKLI